MLLEVCLRVAKLQNNVWQELDEITVDSVSNTVRGSTNSFSIFGLIAVDFLSLIETRKISAGGYHTCGVTPDETVVCWGFNSFGQLGNGTNTDSNVPLAVIGLDGIKSIAAGDMHNMALKGDGTVWSWGSNLRGQLGNDATS